MKSTTRADVSAEEVRYDLDATTYNDLRAEGCPCPRLLVVLVLPAEEERWLD